MKKIYTLVLFVITFFNGNAQIVNIPDANFKAVLLQASPSNSIAKNDDGQYIKIDINDDGEIQQTEANQVAVLAASTGTITSLIGINSFTNLRSLSCGTNQLTSLELSNLNYLISLDCGQNQLISLNLYGLPSLQYLTCYYNQLTSLDVSNCSSLISLNCYWNYLTYLNIKNGNALPWDSLYFDANPYFEYMCVDEEDIPFVQNLINTGSIPPIPINSYCSFTPGGNFFTIGGDCKIDINNNGCDSDDLVYPNLKISITNGTTTGILIANDSGLYSIPVQSGTHTLTPIFESLNYFNIAPTNVSVIFPTAISPYTQNFCFIANGIKNDLEITIIPIQVARPGFDAHYKIVYKNKGNQIANGTLTFSFDDTVMDLISSIPTVDGSGTNSFNWNFTNLNPFETREINVIFNINSPMETPAVNSDDILVYTATIVGPTDETPIDNTFTLNQTVVNSYDPNDKTCLEGNTISPEMVGEYVHYIIRFENTGTFAAENVVIADIIDASKFEINTLIPQSSSHNFFTRINGNKVEFIFENINLPFDDENNDGYVAFKIKTKPNLTLGDEFTNTANIYFDYNFPIITNTTSTTIEEALSNQDFDFETNFTLYPNPAKDVLNIKVKSEMDVKSLSIYNSLGQIIMTTIHSENAEINVSNLQSGSYFIKVFTDQGSSTAKFIKQ